MKERTNWIYARKVAGLTQRDVDRMMYAQHPDQPELRIAQEMLSRFEAGKNVRVNPAALVLLAELYGKTVSEIDPEEGAKLGELRDLLVRQSLCIPELAA